MDILLWNGIGLLFLALSYWIVRNTEVKTYEGRGKTWKKWSFPRWIHLIAWIVYWIFGPLSFAFVVGIAISVAIDCDTNDKRFVCDSKIWNWLTKKV